MRELFFVHCSRAKEVLLSAFSLCERVVPDVLPRSAEHMYFCAGAGGESARDPSHSAAVGDSSEAEGEAL